MKALWKSCVIALFAAVVLFPAPVASEAPTVRRVSSDAVPADKITIGNAEHVALPLIDSVFKARIDTGAATTSIFAIDVEQFELDGEPWVRFVVRNDETDEGYPLEAPLVRVVEIKRRGQEGFTQRPVVSMDLVLGDVSRRIDVNLADRTGFEFPLLIGRDFLAGVAIVDVTLSYTQNTPGAPEAND